MHHRRRFARCRKAAAPFAHRGRRRCVWHEWAWCEAWTARLPINRFEIPRIGPTASQSPAPHPTTLCSVKLPCTSWCSCCYSCLSILRRRCNQTRASRGASAAGRLRKKGCWRVHSTWWRASRADPLRTRAPGVVCPPPHPHRSFATAARLAGRRHKRCSSLHSESRIILRRRSFDLRSRHISASTRIRQIVPLLGSEESRRRQQS